MMNLLLHTEFGELTAELYEEGETVKVHVDLPEGLVVNRIPVKGSINGSLTAGLMNFHIGYSYVTREDKAGVLPEKATDGQMGKLYKAIRQGVEFAIATHPNFREELKVAILIQRVGNLDHEIAGLNGQVKTLEGKREEVRLELNEAARVLRIHQGG